VSAAPRTERALREAMGRLLEGRPTRTDGRLTKNNLWREAQVSRATMNRATGILAEWNERVAQHPATADQQRHREQLAEARGALRTSREQCRRLQDQVDAAATVIMTLLAENAALRQRADRSAVLVPLARRPRG
jgi:hypothetical protein